MVNNPSSYNKKTSNLLPLPPTVKSTTTTKSRRNTKTSILLRVTAIVKSSVLSTPNSVVRICGTNSKVCSVSSSTIPTPMNSTPPEITSVLFLSTGVLVNTVKSMFLLNSRLLKTNVSNCPSYYQDTIWTRTKLLLNGTNPYGMKKNTSPTTKLTTRN